MAMTGNDPTWGVSQERTRSVDLHGLIGGASEAPRVVAAGLDFSDTGRESTTCKRERILERELRPRFNDKRYGP